MTKRLKIIKWLKERVDMEKQLTNWHLDDDYEDFCKEFYPNIFDDKKTMKYMTKYCKILIDYGYLYEPEKIGLGCGGVYQFGTRTQTIWRKNLNFFNMVEPTQKQKEIGMKMSLLEHNFFKKHGKFFEKDILNILKEITP